MIPEMNLPKADMDQGRYYQNGYAAMNELNALQVGRWVPCDVTGGGPANLYNDRVKGVADGLTIYSNVNENGLTINSLEELPKIVSDYMFARIFFINEEDQVNGDIMRSYNFENMDDFALEYDEAANAGPDGRIPVARTKKINSFGIKRVMYPELRVLKHITYTIGESILYQFKYNNWRENLGYVDEERNKDYRKEYFNKENLAKWMLDDLHLTMEVKVLESDADYPGFNDYWHDKAIGYAEDAKKADCPLNELDTIMGEFYSKHFREEGVEAFFQGKAYLHNPGEPIKESRNLLPVLHLVVADNDTCNIHSQITVSTQHSGHGKREENDTHEHYRIKRNIVKVYLLHAPYGGKAGTGSNHRACSELLYEYTQRTDNKFRSIERRQIRITDRERQLYENDCKNICHRVIASALEFKHRLKIVLQSHIPSTQDIEHSRRISR